MEEKIRFSGRELDVMNVLWEERKPLTAKEIAARNPALSINTVQAVLKALLKRGYIKVADIVYSGTVLTRSYETILTADDYMAYQITEGTGKHSSLKGIMVALMKRESNEGETLDKLECLLKEYRNDQKKDS